MRWVSFQFNNNYLLKYRIWGVTATTPSLIFMIRCFLFLTKCFPFTQIIHLGSVKIKEDKSFSCCVSPAAVSNGLINDSLVWKAILTVNKTTSQSHVVFCNLLFGYSLHNEWMSQYVRYQTLNHSQLVFYLLFRHTKTKLQLILSSINLTAPHPGVIRSVAHTRSWVTQTQTAEYDNSSAYKIDMFAGLDCFLYSFPNLAETEMFVTVYTR